MTIVAGTYTTFAAKGIREDLSDMIYDISPQETPLVSMAAKEKCSSTLAEWQTDALAAAVSTNAQLEGDDVTSFTAVTPTVRVGNYTQIFRKTLIISDTEEVVNKAGRKSERAYQTARRGIELRRDMETTFLHNVGGDGGSTTVARRAATLGAWLKTNTNVGSGGADPTHTSGVPTGTRTDGTQRAFTSTIHDNVLQQIWTSGGTLKFVFVGPFNKTVASGFPGIATTTWNMNGRRPEQATTVAGADVYVSDFGTVQIVPTRFQRERDAWYLDFDYITIKHLRPFRRVPLAKTGDAEKLMLINECTLCVKQEAALGLAADLTTS